MTTYEMQPVTHMELKEMPVNTIEYHDVQQVAVPVTVEVPVPYPVEVIKKEYVEVPVEVKVPEYITQTVIEKVVEPAKPVPVIVKTIHDTQVITEDPTEIHHIELHPEPVIASAPPPVRASVPPPPPAASGFNPWWLLLLLCCLPLCLLPFLCCKSVRKYMPGSLSKPTRTD